MADDDVVIATVGGADTARIAAEGVTTLNGATVPLQKVQRLMLSYSPSDGVALDLPAGADGLGVQVLDLPAVALDSATLAALENITVTVANPGSGQATETTLAAVLAAVDGLEGGIAPLATLELLSTGPDTVYRGVAGVTIALAAGERLHSVLVVPSAGGQVTVTVPGQSADQAPVDFPYAEDFKGGIVGAGNLVIAGAVAYYRVTTLTP